MIKVGFRYKGHYFIAEVMPDGTAEFVEDMVRTEVLPSVPLPHREPHKARAWLVDELRARVYTKYGPPADQPSPGLSGALADLKRRHPGK